MLIKLPVILNKITSLVDGGWRISFDANQTEVEQIMELSKHRDLLLKLTVEIEAPNEKGGHEFNILFENQIG